jgi:hypothetical protein
MRYPAAVHSFDFHANDRPAQRFVDFQEGNGFTACGKTLYEGHGFSRATLGDD